MTDGPCDRNLDRTAANYVPLTPLTYLDRVANVWPDRTAVIHGDRRYTWTEARERCLRLASALSGRGIRPGETVAVMAPNIPEMFECHFGVPMSGAVLNAINTRLDPATIAYILDHGEARVLIVDREYSDRVSRALAQLDREILVVDIDDPLADGGAPVGDIDYETFLGEGSPDFRWLMPEDEWDAIALNYTSGTTGNPKGVVYHHRGACLNAMGNILAWSMPQHPVYLWTLPMFHCNGWCFPWAIAALAGTHVCLRNVTAGEVFRAIADHGVTHLCGAPVILGMLVNADPSERFVPEHPVQVMTAASPPPATVLEAIETAGFRVTHVYGLTEVYGPAVVCAWNGEWDSLSPPEQAALKARQGVRYPVLEDLMVADPESMQPVPADGETIGEVFMRGNIVMKGYLKNPTASADAFAGGWFHTGDLGVRHADGYIELKDRSKDIIISGGENISSIEVEGVLYRHPAVLEAAVVARPHEKWGESPCAFITLKDGVEAVREQEIIDFCRDNMAHFKVPGTIVFGPLPKTSTGKVQKFVLRDRAAGLDGS